LLKNTTEKHVGRGTPKKGGKERGGEAVSKIRFAIKEKTIT